MSRRAEWSPADPPEFTRVSMADEADAGYAATVLRRRGGRRPLGSGPADVVPVRLDPELRTALAARADAEHTSASDVIRQALGAWLDVV